MRCCRKLTHHLLLRAERAGDGNGRTYTITITCTNDTKKTILNKNCDGIRTPRSGKVDSWQQITLMLRSACATRRMDELRSSQSRALCPCGTGEKPTCAMPRCRKDTDVHAQPTTLATSRGTDKAEGRWSPIAL